MAAVSRPPPCEYARVLVLTALTARVKNDGSVCTIRSNCCEYQRSVFPVTMRFPSNTGKYTPSSLRSCGRYTVADMSGRAIFISCGAYISVRSVLSRGLTISSTLKFSARPQFIFWMPPVITTEPKSILRYASSIHGAIWGCSGKTACVLPSRGARVLPLSLTPK